MTKEELEEVCKEIRDLNEERSILEVSEADKIMDIAVAAVEAMQIIKNKDRSSPLERIALALERITNRLDSWDSESQDSRSYLSIKDYSDF